MSIIDSVVVESSPVTTLQVFHKRMKIPISIYLNSVSGYTDPWNEKAYQWFVQQYLYETKDPGIVGMVRQECDSDYVYLDAALRYPTES